VQETAYAYADDIGPTVTLCQLYGFKA